MNKNKIENLKQLSHEELTSIIYEYCKKDKDFNSYILQEIASNSDNEDELLLLVKKEIHSLTKSKQFIDYKESVTFAKRLEKIRNLIINRLKQKDLQSAILQIKSLLELEKSIFKRVDDSYGYIGSMFSVLIKDLGDCYSGSKDNKELVQFLIDRIITDEYGLYDNIISYFKEALDKKGLKQIEEALESEIKKDKSGYKKHSFIKTLKDIADLRKDIKGYIKLGKDSSDDYMDIAERYIKVWKEKEAVSWLEKVKNTNNERYFDLKAKILEANGKYKESEELKFEWFKKTLSIRHYEECLKHTQDKIVLKTRAINAALKYQDSLSALHCLCKIGAEEQAAEKIRKEYKDFDGRNYSIIKDVAKAIAREFPLEASLLYRSLINGILIQARSKYYLYAMSYIKKLIELEKRISDWHEIEDNIEYFKTLKQEHKKKAAFWVHYKSTLNKIEKKGNFTNYAKYLEINQKDLQKN